MDKDDLFPEVELMEHIVDIDKFMEVRLKIPKRLNALELKALMSKANKMFNLADVPIVAEQPQPTSNLGGRPRTWSKIWNEQNELDLARLKLDGYTALKIAQFLNVKYNLHLSKGRINGKVFDLKHKDKRWSKLLMMARDMPSIDILEPIISAKTNGLIIESEDVTPRHIPKIGKRRPYVVWKPEWEDDLMVLRNAGLKYRLITDKLNERYNLQLRTKQVDKKAYTLKQKGLWKQSSDIVGRVRELKSKEVEDKQTEQFSSQMRQASTTEETEPVERGRTTQDVMDKRYEKAYKLHRDEGLPFSTALHKVFAYRVGGSMQQKFRKWCDDRNLPYKILSQDEVIRRAREKAQEMFTSKDNKKIKKSKHPMFWEEKHTSHIIEQFDLNKSSKEIRDYFNEKFNLLLTHKQIIDKIYLMKKQGILNLEKTQETMFPQKTFSDEIVEEMKFLDKLGYAYVLITEKINERFGTDFVEKQIRNKLGTLKRDGILPKTAVTRKNTRKVTIWKPEWETHLVEYYNLEYDVRRIRDLLNKRFGIRLKHSQVDSKIKYLKHKGEL